MRDDSNLDSPFSQKNIQECRCGTESCRGVLGPKPKKPVEEKSLTSALIAGTKRKLQDLLGSKRGGSESSQNSPKKRKLLAGKIGSIKARNKLIASQTAREQAEQEASEHSRQTASRENRALKRSAPATTGRQARAAKSSTTRPTAVKLTRHTTVTFQRKVSRPGALKSVKKFSRTESGARQAESKPKGSKGVRSAQRPSTPDRETSDSASESEDDHMSVNITPASLRSATRKSAQSSPVVRGRPDAEVQASGISRKSNKASLHSPAKLQSAQNKAYGARGR